jgi:hypothetical protein
MKHPPLKKSRKQIRPLPAILADKNSEFRSIKRYFGRIGVLNTFRYGLTIKLSVIKSNVYRKENTGSTHRIAVNSGGEGALQVCIDDNKFQRYYARFASEKCRINSSTALESWKVFSKHVVYTHTLIQEIILLYRTLETYGFGRE